MTYSNKNINNFTGGEGSPKMAARTDLPVFTSIYQRVENFIPLPQGPLEFRPGTQFINHTRLGLISYFIPFLFSDAQAYLLEFSTSGFIRFYEDTNGNNPGVIVNNPTTISHITNASPAVVTDTAHGYTNGQEVFISGVNGMTQTNGNYYIVTGATANTFQLYDIFGNPIDSTTFTAYASGGSAESIYEIISPYAIADVPQLQYAQNADVMYIVHQGYAPMKLVRSGPTSWVIGTYTRNHDPFTGAGNWPGAIAFTSDQRLAMAGTVNNPETIWGSMSPDVTGASRYDDFTTGTNSVNAYQFTMSPQSGKVDAIRFLSYTNQFMVIGCYGSTRQMYGAALGQAPNPLEVNILPIDSYGVLRSIPIPLGTSFLYLQKNTTRVRAIEFDIYINAFKSVDRTLVSDGISQYGFRKIVWQASNINIAWAVGLDNKLYGMTFDIDEKKYAWHRHSIGGNGKLIDIGILVQSNGSDLLWAIVQRTINGNVVCYIEYFSPQPIYPNILDFYSGPLNKISDTLNYRNALYEQQKLSVHMDCATIYDGSSFGTNGNITITPGAGSMTQGTTGVTFTASSPFFLPTMLTEQIWGRYNTSGIGGGRFRIDAYVSSTVVTGTILSVFPSLTPIVPGNWFLTARVISNLGYLEGQFVCIVADGAIVASQTIINGTIDIGYNASYIQIGLPYTGLINTFPIDQGGTTGPAQDKPKKVVKMAVRVINTSGISFSTNDPYSASFINFRFGTQRTDRPIPLWTGVVGPETGSAGQFYGKDGWTHDKSIMILQTYPLPATIASIDVFADTGDEV